MKWHCIDCYAVFFAAGDRIPNGGCPQCGGVNYRECPVPDAESARQQPRPIEMEVVSSLPPGLDGRGAPGEVKRGPVMRLEPPRNAGVFTEAMLHDLFSQMGRRAR